MFVGVTETSGGKIFVNFDHVVYMKRESMRSDEATVLQLTYGVRVVHETPEEIMEHLAPTDVMPADIT